VFDTNFAQVTTPGAFSLLFNVDNLGGKLYVTYAMQNDEKHDDVADRATASWMFTT
jgi:hypothetical protein